MNEYLFLIIDGAPNAYTVILLVVCTFLIGKENNK